MASRFISRSLSKIFAVKSLHWKYKYLSVTLAVKICQRKLYTVFMIIKQCLHNRASWVCTVIYKPKTSSSITESVCDYFRRFAFELIEMFGCESESWEQSLPISTWAVDIGFTKPNSRCVVFRNVSYYKFFYVILNTVKLN